MDKVLFITDPDSAEVFMLLDQPVRIVHDPGETEAMFTDALREGYSIIFITESEAAAIQRQIAKARQGSPTIVMVIPGMGSSRDTGMRQLQALRKSVTGM